MQMKSRKSNLCCLSTSFQNKYSTWLRLLQRRINQSQTETDWDADISQYWLITGIVYWLTFGAVNFSNKCFIVSSSTFVTTGYDTENICHKETVWELRPAAATAVFIFKAFYKVCFQVTSSESDLLIRWVTVTLFWYETKTPLIFPARHISSRKHCWVVSPSAGSNAP